MQLLAEAFGCQVASLPFTYLGFPLGTARPQLQDLMPLVFKLERRLSSISHFLSQGARLQLVDSALSSMPIYFLCSLSLPPGIIKPMERILRQVLWSDDPDNPKQSLAAWDMLTKPKDKGGVGLVNFKKKNEALLMKHLDKFYNKANVPWVNLLWSTYYEDFVPHADKLCGSFWWRDIFKLVDDFRAISHIKPGRGDSIIFWSDKWMFDGSSEPLSGRFPRLFSYVLYPQMSASLFYNTADRRSLFYLPLSEQAYEEYNQLNHLIAANPLSLDRDLWVYDWGDSYPSARYYKHIHAHIQVMPVFKWLWKSSCMMRVKFFAWLLLVDRLNSRDMLQRRHWKVTEDVHCVLCPTGAREDRMHLFFECNFSQRVWNYLQIDWSLAQDIQGSISAAKLAFRKPFFMEVLMLACWNIWKQRNGKIFRNDRPTFGGWKRAFIHDLSMLGHRIKNKHHDELMAWIGILY
jgi:hypothetical protein